MKHQVLPVLSLPSPRRVTLSPEMNSEQHPTHPGDDGHSDLLSDGRPPKSDPVFECLGWLDELNSLLGLLRVAVRAVSAAGGDTDHIASPNAGIRSIQLTLGRIMGMVAAGAGGPGSDTPETGAIIDSDVAALEELERDLRARTTVEARFYVPGDGTEASALADVARARCRTAERAFVAFMSGRPLDLAPAHRFLNRLSDYLFVVARHLDGPR